MCSQTIPRLVKRVEALGHVIQDATSLQVVLMGRVLLLMGRVLLLMGRVLLLIRCVLCCWDSPSTPVYSMHLQSLTYTHNHSTPVYSVHSHKKWIVLCLPSSCLHSGEYLQHDTQCRQSRPGVWGHCWVNSKHSTFAGPLFDAGCAASTVFSQALYLILGAASTVVSTSFPQAVCLMLAL